MIDTHSHLLPGLDDGPSSLEESLALAREASHAGVSQIVCTPHLRDLGDPTERRAPDVIAEVQAALDAAHVPIRLHLGYELAFSFAIGLDVDSLKRYTMGGSSAILVEAPYSGWPPFADELVFQWRLQGLLPVFAHPERSERVQRDPAMFTALLRQGALAQATSPSVGGRFGTSSRRALLGMLARGELALLASDDHGHSARDFPLLAAERELRRVAPHADLHSLTVENPARLLRGEELLPVAPVRVSRPWEIYLRRVF